MLVLNDLTFGCDDLSAAAPRVGLFTSGIERGALAAVTAGLAVGFGRHGIKVEILHVHDARGRSSLEYPKATSFFQLRARRSRNAVPELIRYLRRRRIEVLISLGWLQNLPAIAASVLARWNGILIVREAATLSREARLEHHSSLTLRQAPRLARLLYPRADAVVANSEGVRQDLIDEVGVDPQGVPIVAIANPVDLDRVRRLAEEPMAVRPWLTVRGEPVFVHVARLAPQKNQAFLLEVFARYVARAGAGRLLIVGDGPERLRLKQTVERSGLSDRVTMLGWTDNPFPYIKGADALLLTSREEGFGLVLVEAMALGTPVIATDCPGGVREVLREGRAGLLVPSGSAELFVEAMVRAIGDSRLRSVVIAEGRRQASEYSPEHIAFRWIELMRRLVTSRFSPDRGGPPLD